MILNRLYTGATQAMGSLASAAMASAPAQAAATAWRGRFGALREQASRQLSNFQPSRLSGMLQRFYGGKPQSGAASAPAAAPGKQAQGLLLNKPLPSVPEDKPQSPSAAAAAAAAAPAQAQAQAQAPAAAAAATPAPAPAPAPAPGTEAAATTSAQPAASPSAARPLPAILQSAMNKVEAQVDSTASAHVQQVHAQIVAMVRERLEALRNCLAELLACLELPAAAQKPAAAGAAPAQDIQDMGEKNGLELLGGTAVPGHEEDDELSADSGQDTDAAQEAQQPDTEPALELPTLGEDNSLALLGGEAAQSPQPQPHLRNGSKQSAPAPQPALASEAAPKPQSAVDIAVQTPSGLVSVSVKVNT